MHNENKENIRNATNIIHVAKREGLLTESESVALNKLLNKDYNNTKGILCKRILSHGFEKLHSKHGKVMEEINKFNPFLAKFIIRSKSLTRLSNNLESAKRTEVILKWQVKDLISSANRDNLISLEESTEYLDLIDWDETNYQFVERDILRKVDDWIYLKFKDEAPNVLDYIKRYYESWYDKILKPHAEKLKTKIDKEN